jgi:hypothetical protein
VTGEPHRAAAPPQPGIGPAGARRLVLPAAIAVIAVVIAVVAANLIGGPGRRVEAGIVVAVEATGLTSVQGFSIRTADGRTVDFRVANLENGATFPPGHLAEHRASLVPIRVTYIDEGGAHLAVRLEDAP